MRRAWLVWGLGAAAYAVAVLQRTSLGVVGIEAADHFGVPVGILSTFIVVQLLIYAAMQVPAGVLLDRLGSRLMLTIGLSLMCLGQVLMALTTDLSLGFLARIVVGAGDAFIFGSVLRMLPAWFPPTWVPMLSQLTGLIGATGQIISATGFMALLHNVGWTPGFLAAAATALLAAALSAAFVRNQPPGHPPPEPPAPVRQLPSEVAAIWKHPGTQLGLWTNMVTGFSPMVFAMMWGIPYLVKAEGVSLQAASGYYTLLTLASVVFGPTVGLLTARHPLRRSNLVLVSVAANALPWMAILVWPGPAPSWLLTVLVIGLALGGPGSGIGMDYARTSMPRHRLGTATGIVIIGAFTAAVVNILLIGILLDWLSPDGSYSLHTFRLALWVQVPFWVVGTIGVLASRARLRREMATLGIVVPPWKDALRRRYGRGDDQNKPGGSGGGA